MRAPGLMFSNAIGPNGIASQRPMFNCRVLYQVCDSSFAAAELYAFLQPILGFIASVDMSSTLQFGITTFGDIAPNSSERPEAYALVIKNIIEEAALADSMGVDYFGAGEHHRSDFAISSPETILAVIAGRTRHIRLCSATTVLSTDDPVRVFERFSTLHAASSGRAELILGRGWFSEPFPLFGYAPSDYDTLFEEKLDLFVALTRQRAVTWQGKGRPALVNQRLFPPIEPGALRSWIAVGSTPESVLRAARRGLPMMVAVIGGEPGRFSPLMEMYRVGCEKLGRPAEAVGLHSNGHIADTDEQAREEYWRHYKPLRDRLGAERGWTPIDRKMFDLEIARGSLFVGAPETVARRIAQAVTDLSASRFDLKYSCGTLPHEKMMRSIELFAGKVIPAVRAHLESRFRNSFTPGLVPQAVVDPAEASS